MAEQDEEVERAYWVPTEYESQYGDHIPQGIASARRNLDYRGSFVLFVDILGFASLVEEDEQLDLRRAAGMSGTRASLRGEARTPLRIRFEKFHRVLEQTLTEAKPWRPPAIVFSDSAFVSVEFLDMMLDLARSLMRSLILEDVPVRMGVGFGGFFAQRFSTETRGPKTHHISEFFGTAVVHAHQAESCGVSGMRILIHPSVDQWIQRQEAEAMPVRKVPKFSTVSLTTTPKHGVLREVDYLRHTDEDDLLFEAVKRMHSESPPSALRHYEETLIAMGAMKAVSVIGDVDKSRS